MSNEIYGWFDDATQREPSHNPRVDAICLFCGIAITPQDVRTHSLMYAGQYAARSYFYRTHRTCADADPTHTAKDKIVLDMIRQNGD